MDLSSPLAAVPFRGGGALLQGVDADVAARIIAASGDVALVLDGGGIIRDVALGSGEFAKEGFDSWIDRPWIDTVTAESRGKIEEMLRDAGSRTAARWRQVNHPLAEGEVPIRYLAIDAANDGRVIAIGRDMRAAAALQQRLLAAQQSMERDYVRLRQVETRYRLLFEQSGEAVFIVETATRRITEANPAARGLTAGVERLAGQAFAAQLAPASRDTALALLGAVAAAEQVTPAVVETETGTLCSMSATLFRQDRGSYFLVRLAPAGVLSPVGAGPAADAPDRRLVDVLDRLPDAFVLTDDNLDIITENAAFLDLSETPRRSALKGAPLSRFLGRPGIDLGVLVQQLRDHGTVRNFATIVRGQHGAEEEVEVSAVLAGEPGQVCFGFSLRTARRSAIEIAPTGRALPRSVEQLTELVGRVPLKDIVRESTDLIERLCIEAALTYTSDNRASAAEILGLSRQSLYSKLHRHGLGNLSGVGDE
ncbi:transcriptional regulator PpsR [Sphingosinicellaceae bacterium]|nr:transcriptional regulator PpsR [Sphingosinicellaceae bacterium]